MGFKEQYEKGKLNLKNDTSICKENRKFFEEFLNQEEYYLKRKRDLIELNERVCKTLLHYIQFFKNVNVWFRNKPLKKITEEDIKIVYDGLEEGRIKNRKGLRFVDRNSYYNKVFKGKPFKMIGKDVLAKKIIIVVRKENKEVRFITEEDFEKILLFINNPEHKLILRLCWDIGENCTSLIILIKRNLERLLDEDSKDPYYNIRLSSEILKTSRTERTEPTIFDETCKLLDIILKDKKPDDKVFNFSKESLVKVFNRAVKKSKVLTKPDNKKPTIKDLRSSMCCNLINKGWSSDEIKSRLGHKPSSTIIDKYLNYFAMNKVKTRKKVKIFEVEKLKEQQDETDKLVKKLREENKILNSKIDDVLNTLEFFIPPQLERLKQTLPKNQQKDFEEGVINRFKVNPPTTK